MIKMKVTYTRKGDYLLQIYIQKKAKIMEGLEDMEY